MADGIDDPQEREAEQSNPTSAPIEQRRSPAAITRRRRLASWDWPSSPAALVTFGGPSRPADPVEPLALQKSDRLTNFDAAPLRVATFNIHAGVGRDGVRDLNRTAKALADMDVAALQEVRNPLFGSHGPQISDVADKLGMAWLFVPAEKRWWRNDYGTGLFTRVPLTDCVRIPLPTPSRQRFRTAFLANFPFRGRTVHLLAVHIDKDMEQNTHDNQLHTIARPVFVVAGTGHPDGRSERVRLASRTRAPDRDARSPQRARRASRILPSKAIRSIGSSRGASARFTPNGERTPSDHPVACAELELSTREHVRRAGSGRPCRFVQH